MPTEGIIPPGANVDGYTPGASHYFPIKSPGAVNFYGHSYVTGGNGIGSSAGAGLMNNDQTLVRMILTALGMNEANMLNFAQDGASLIDDNTSSLPGGHVQVLQTYSPINVRQAVSAKAPWTNDFGLCVLFWGINDINRYGGGSQNALFRKAYQEALRTVISRCRSAAVYEALTDTTNTFYSGGGLGGANWTSTASTTTCSGAGFARTSTVGANVVIVTPADYDGECISLGFIGRKGATGGQANILIDGVIVDRINTSNIIADCRDRGNAAISCTTALVLTRRYKVQKNVAHTITITTTGIDGNFDYNFYQFEAAEANPIIVCGINRLKLYLAGLTQSGDAAVLDWNNAILELLPEFPGPIEFADSDDAINQSSVNSAYVNNRLSWDTTHPSESGYRHLAIAIIDAWIRICRRNSNLGSITPARGNYGTGYSVPVAQVVPSYYLLPGPAAPNGATAAMAASVLVAIPYIVTRACTLRNIVFDSVTAFTGAGTVQIGLMADKLNSGSPATISGPQLKIYDWGTFTVTVATPKAFAIPAGSQKIIIPGIYWLVLIPQAGVTITATQIAGSNPYISSLSLFTPRPVSAVAVQYSIGGGFTTVPNILPAAGVTNANVATAPFCAFDVASVP